MILDGKIEQSFCLGAQIRQDHKSKARDSGPKNGCRARDAVLQPGSLQVQGNLSEEGGRKEKRELRYWKRGLFIAENGASLCWKKKE